MKIVNQNRNKIEPYSELVGNTLMHYNMELRSNEQQEPILENYEIHHVTETKELTDNQHVVDISILYRQYFHSDDEISANI